MLNEETESRNPEDNTQSTRFRSNYRLIFYFPMILTFTNHISQSCCPKIIYLLEENICWSKDLIFGTCM